ncbi:hypothetical protein D3C77_575670 [compost metagenome]
MVKTGQDLAVGNRFTWGIAAFPVPLQPPAGVGDRAVFFGKAGGWQPEHFGLDRRGIDIVHLAVVLPEIGGFRDQRVDDHQELQLDQ